MSLARRGLVMNSRPEPRLWSHLQRFKPPAVDKAALKEAKVGEPQGEAHGRTGSAVFTGVDSGIRRWVSQQGEGLDASGLRGVGNNPRKTFTHAGA